MPPQHKAKPFIAHAKRFKNAREKAGWMDGRAAVDAIAPEVVNLAREILGGKMREGQPVTDPETALRDLFLFVRNRIRYQTDAASPDKPPAIAEELASAPVVLRRGFDDCDGKVRLYVATARAIGQMRPRWQIAAITQPVVDATGKFYHVQARVSWANSNGSRLVETTLEGVPFGAGSEVGVIGPDGHFITA